MVELGGHLATNAGVAICGAAVAVFPTSVNATQATSTDCATTTTTTSSGGDWAVSCLAANTYDVRITCGSSVRWRRYIEEVQITTGTLANLDVDGTVDADVTDFDVLSSGDIDLVSSANAAAAIYIAQSTGTSGTVKIHADTGTSVTEGAESINILSDVGGVGIRSTANLANAINITADGSAASTIQIYNDSGTAVNEGVASIQLLSDDGGIGIKSGLDAAGAIRLTADAGTSETIILHSDLGTGEGSITLTSDAGGIDLNAAAGKDIALDSGQVLVTATHNTACTIYLHANGGTSETIKLHADQGTGEGSIVLTSDAGGIDLNAAATKDITLDSGQVLVTAAHNTACAIYLRANAGTSETIKIHSDLGTSVTEGAASVSLISDVGGVELRSTANLANAINLTVDNGTTSSIAIFNDTGSATDSISLKSDAGGITLNPGTFVTVGANATNAAEVRMFEDTDNGCNYVALKAPNVSTSYTITLPTAVAGTCGFVLTSTTAGVTSWAASGGGASQADEAALECETDEDTYAPPDLIKHSPGVAKGYAVALGGDGALQCGSYNVSAAARSNSGRYSVTWCVEFADVNYTTVATAEFNSAGEGMYNVNVYNPATTNVQIQILDAGSNYTDSDYQMVSFGSQ